MDIARPEWGGKLKHQGTCAEGARPMQCFIWLGFVTGPSGLHTYDCQVVQDYLWPGPASAQGPKQAACKCICHDRQCHKTCWASDAVRVVDEEA